MTKRLSGEYTLVMKIFEPLKKTFIKDYKNTSDPDVRFRYGVTAGIFGIVTNAVLFVMKVVVGLLSRSISVIADAVNNLSDAGSSGVTLIGFKLSNRPADKEHPFGHARYEYITGLVVAFIILIIGGSLLKSSIEKLIEPTAIEASVWTAVILAVSILLKTVQGLLYRDFGKSISSTSLYASATDSRNDVISTTLVLASTIGAIFRPDVFVIVDAAVGLAVSLFILISGIKLVKETIDPLLGGKPDKELVDHIIKKVSSYPGILGVHDLMVHNYGPAKSFASLHAEVDAGRNVMESHDLIDNIERDFHSEGIFMVIHMDPVITDDPELNEMKQSVTDLIDKRYDGKIKLHDFRLVKGVTHTNVLFDAVVPFEMKITAKELADYISANIPKTDKIYYFVINIDRAYD